MTLQNVDRNENVGAYIARYSYETLRLYAYLLIGFLVPFTLGHPQELVGIIVNATLILGAIEIGPVWRVAPLLFAPSLGVLARGLIFGPFTPFLIIMLPFIWTGNAILVFGFRELYRKRRINYGITLGISALVKSGFLFLSAFVLVSASILPVLFLTAMGITQLFTALTGGVLAFGLHKSGITRLGGFDS